MNAPRNAAFASWIVAGLVALAVPAGAVARWTPPVSRTLSNGLQVAVFHEPRLPVVQIQLLVEAGTAAEPADAAGVAHVTAELLLRGTSSRSAGAMALELDGIAGNLQATATRDYATLDGAFLARDLDQGIELMSDAVLNPLFSEAELRQIQAQTMVGIRDARHNAGAYADEMLWESTFPGHAYARPLRGTPETVARMNRDRVLRFYLAQYRPEHATLVIAGDVTPERAFAAAEEWFGRWAGKPATPAAAPDPAVAPSRLSIRIIDSPGATFSHVRLGLAAPPRGSADEAAFTLVNALLGGSASSRWAKSRALGAASGARSAYSLLEKGGLLAAALVTPTDSVASAVSRLRASIRRFASAPPNEAELAPVRKTAGEVFPMRFETLGGVIGYWSGSTHAGIVPDADRDAEKVASVTAAQLAEVARRWLVADKMAVVVIGPAARLKPALARLGTVEVVSAERVGGSAAGAPVAANLQARGREIVKQALVAHGGLERLEKIQDSTVEANATLATGAREVQGEITQIRKEPDRMLVDTHFSGVSSVQAISGNRGWTSSKASSDTRQMDTLMVAGMRAGFSTDVHHLLLSTQLPGALLASRGRETVAERPAEVVELRTGGLRRLLYFDVEHHYLIAMDQEATPGMGFSARRLYGDYRPVQGVPWPHLEERLLDGRRVMLLEVKRVVLDSGIEDVVFERHSELPPLPAR